MEDILIGTTDRTILVFIPDPASTTGAGKTALAHSDVTVTYTRVETDNDVVHTDVTSSMNALSNLTDAHNDWGWKEVSSTLSKGLYRLDLADALFVSGAWYTVVQVTITSGTAAATPKVFRLVARNDLDGVRLGLTALPNAAADAAGGLPISDAGGLDLDAQIGTKINDILTDTGTTLQAEVDGIQADTEDIQSRLPAALTAGGRMNSDAVAISGSTTAADNVEANIGNLDATVSSRASQASVDDLPTNAELATSQAAADDATLAAIAALNNLSAAQVNAEVDTALTDIHLDHLLAVTYDPASKPGAADALLNELVESDAGVARYTANALEQAPTGGSAPTAGEIADAVWDEATAAHTTSGTFGEQVKTDVDAILADTNELQTDWVNGGRLDNILDARASQTSVDDLPTNAELATALGTADDATLAAIAALNNLSSAQAQAAAAAALTAYDPPTRTEATSDKDEIIAEIAGISAGSGLNAQEVRDAMKLAPSAGDPAAGSIDAKIDALSVSAGSGAFTITVTVTDGINYLQGATVRITEGVTTHVAITDAAGNAQFALDALTYHVAVTKDGYTFTPETRTVTGEESGTLIDALEMTATAEEDEDEAESSSAPTTPCSDNDPYRTYEEPTPPIVENRDVPSGLVISGETDVTYDEDGNPVFGEVPEEEDVSSGVDADVESIEDLIAIATVDIEIGEAGAIKMWIDSATGSFQVWQLETGTDAHDPLNGVARPDDFNAVTNARIWLKRN